MQGQPLQLVGEFGQLGGGVAGAGDVVVGGLQHDAAYVVVEDEVDDGVTRPGGAAGEGNQEELAHPLGGGHVV